MIQIIRLIIHSKLQNTHWKIDSHSSGNKFPVFIEHNKLLPCLHKQASWTWIMPIYHLPTIKLPLMPRSHKWFIPFTFHDQSSTPIFFIFQYMCYMFLPSHPPWYTHFNNITQRTKLMKFLTIIFSVLLCNTDKRQEISLLRCYAKLAGKQLLDDTA
jgi:hypothetical protein